MKNNEMQRSVVIIGAGTAGLTAAIYTARAHLEPLVIRGPKPGGQLATTSTVENYPGFANGVLGPALMECFAAQAERFNTELLSGTITNVDFAHRPFRLQLDEEQWISTQVVIIATGANPRYLGLDNERRLLGRGVSCCATCDGCFFQDLDVAVIGGGDAALENALFLTHFASQVYVIHRRDQLRASKIMQRMAVQNDKIQFIWNSEVIDILGDQEVEGIQLKNTLDGHLSTLSVQGVFVAIGHRPNTQIFRPWIKTDKEGYILTHPDSSHTNIPGIFACGDAQDRIYRQAVTAAGSGCKAAIDAERWLQSSTHRSKQNLNLDYAFSGAGAQPPK